jgi:DnaJ-class molecular chaperone
MVRRGAATIPTRRRLDARNLPALQWSWQPSRAHRDDTNRMADDYYKTLGVKRDASQAEIQKAYRDLARKYHPDLNPDDKTAKKKFQEVQSAFDVLNDPSKREMYDRYGANFEQMGQGPQGPRRGPAGGQPGMGPEDFDFSQFFGERFGAEGGGGFGDIFGQFRRGGGGRASRTAKLRGEDVRHELEVPFLTAVNGGEVHITLAQESGQSETLAVKIPTGIDEGKTIRLRGKGTPGYQGGPAGDLLIAIHVAPHPYFQRSGNNLLVKAPVTVAEAALGAKIDVPTARGKVSVRVPPGTSSGRKLRIKGQGVKPVKGEPGDLLVEIHIVLPKTIDERGQELIRQFDQLYPMDPRSELPW